MPPQQHEESVFNMALAYLKRIDKILYFCQQSAMSGNIDNWTNNLRGVYRELAVKLNDEEKKDITGTDKTVNPQTLTDDVIEESEANFKNIYFLVNNPALKNEHKRTIMFLLDALEIKIRTKLQDKGMLLPSKQDPTRAILKM